MYFLIIGFVHLLPASVLAWWDVMIRQNRPPLLAPKIRRARRYAPQRHGINAGAEDEAETAALVKTAKSVEARDAALTWFGGALPDRGFWGHGAANADRLLELLCKRLSLGANTPIPAK